MQTTLATIHEFTGYAVFLVVLGVVFAAFNRARNAQEFAATPFSIAAVLLDLQVLLGIATYGTGRYWEVDEPLIQFVHPIIMLVALGVAHAGLGRARREQMAADAHRLVGRMFSVALVLILAGIGVASAVV